MTLSCSSLKGNHLLTLEEKKDYTIWPTPEKRVISKIIAKTRITRTGRKVRRSRRLPKNCRCQRRRARDLKAKNWSPLSMNINRSEGQRIRIMKR